MKNSNALPIIEEEILHISHIHWIKFINAENFEEFFNRCHAIATRQIDFRIISDER